jgi:hypothetical protein
MAVMTRARLAFPVGDPLELRLDDVVAYGPPIPGFRPWLGAVFASAAGRWVIRIGEDEILGFTREELRRVRMTAAGAELTLGRGEGRTIAVPEAAVTAYGPEPTDLRSWLGRLAHGTGDAWLRFADGHELRFPIGNGPHLTLLEPRAAGPAAGTRD